MERTDVLLTIAEVAVAFAGFASLASLIGRGSSTTDPRVDAVRLRNMLSISLTVVGLSLIPVLLLSIAPSEAIGWIVSSAIAFVWTAVVAARGIRRAAPVEEALGYDKPGARFIRGLGFAAAAGLFVNATGIPGAYAPDVYLAALLLALAASGMLFTRLIGSVLAEGSGRSSRLH